MRNQKVKTRRRVPFIQQMQQTECGLCCMLMISGYYKSYVSLYELRERLGSGRDGTSLFHLKKLGEQLGFEANCYKLTREELTQVYLPAILFWDNKHYVVLEKITGKHVIIVDPAIGRRKLTPEAFEKSYSGYVMTLIPGEGVKPQKNQGVWGNFLKNLWKMPQLFITILIFSLFLQLFTLGMPLLIQFVIDEIITPKAYGLLDIFLLGIILLVLFQTAFTFLRGKLLITLQNRLDYQLMTQFFKHLLQLPYQFFQLRSFGDLIFRANSLRIIRDLLSNQLVQGILDLGLLVVILLYMLSSSFIMTGWVLLIASINIIILLVSRPRITEANQEEITKHALVQGSQTEILYGIFGVKTAGVEKMMYQRWLNQFQGLIQAYRRKESILNYVNTLTGALTIFAPLLLLWIGVNQVVAGVISLGGLIAFYSISTQFFSLSNSIVNTANAFILTESYLRRVQDVLDAPPEITSKDALQLESLQGRIELQNVSFSYTKYSPPVIKNITLKIEPGQKVALVGKSGSGKSTLARIILGLYQPDEGRILYDGHDLANLDKSTLRKQMGVVPQDVTLLNRSILENIVLHNPKATMEEVIQAAKVAQIHDEIMAMPMKYHTMISEMGMNVSGGQRQRIALAQALLHKPSVLVLDEATSSLDHVNEEEIDAMLEQMKCTRIVIAHRLTTVMNADIILVLEDGKVIEQGTHEQLLRSSEYYRSFYKEDHNRETMLTK